MKNIFIYNLESGQKNLKKYLPYITKMLNLKFGEVECVSTTHANHAFEIAQKAEGVDHIIVAGGDGTLNEVINGVGRLENKPTIALIPTGTVNDVARSLGIKRTIKGAVKTIISGEPTNHDIFKVNERYGIYVCCAGLFSETSYTAERKKKKYFGRLAYFFKGIAEIFKSKPINVALKTETETISKTCSLVLILNSKSVAGFRLNKKAKLDDGVVEVAMFKSTGKRTHLLDVLRVANTFLFGLWSAKNKKYVTYRQLSKFTLKTNDEIPINMDGEKTSKGSFDFSVINNGIKIIAPKRKI
jgi:diacylglycerol kinase (ATP)